MSAATAQAATRMAASQVNPAPPNLTLRALCQVRGRERLGYAVPN